MTTNDTTYPESRESFARPSDHLTIEQRLARLEAWTRNEIFARTAMDEPDPTPEPEAGEDDPYLTYEQEMQKWRHIEHIHYITTPTQCTNLKAARDEMIRLGLAVSPDDPRLRPLVVTEDFKRAIGELFQHVPYVSIKAIIARTIDHLNAARGPVVPAMEEDR